jgi:hypothetical protein
MVLLPWNSVLTSGCQACHVSQHSCSGDAGCVCCHEQVLWKKSAPYNFKCRKVIQLPGDQLHLAGHIFTAQRWSDTNRLLLVQPTFSDPDPFGPAGKPQPMEEATPEAADGLMGDDAAARERVLKFEVQMYRLRDGEYVVDFQVGCPAVTMCWTKPGSTPLARGD